jgi:hypothetical protein
MKIGLNVGLNILIGMIMVFGILFVLYNDHSTVQNNVKKELFNQNNVKKELFNQKVNLIYPYRFMPLVTNPKKSIEHIDLINFLFSIQDLYIYNPQAYGDMTEHIDYILRLYDEVIDDTGLAGSNYYLIQDQKNNALNSLQSILLKMPQNTEYDNKLKNATTILEKILNEYMNKTYVIYERNLYENGYTANTRTIETGPVGYDPKSKNMYHDLYELFQ